MGASLSRTAQTIQSQESTPQTSIPGPEIVIVREQGFATLDDTELLKRIAAEHLAGIYINYSFLRNAIHVNLLCNKKSEYRDAIEAVLKEPLDNPPEEGTTAYAHWQCYRGMLNAVKFYQTSDPKVLKPIRRDFKDAAKRGSVLAKYYLAKHYPGSDKSVKKIQLLQEASMAGCIPAKFYLARWRNINKKAFLQQAIDAGYAEAMSYVAASSAGTEHSSAQLNAQAAALGDRDGLQLHSFSFTHGTSGHSRDLAKAICLMSWLSFLGDDRHQPWIEEKFQDTPLEKRPALARAIDSQLLESRRCSVVKRFIKEYKDYDVTVTRHVSVGDTQSARLIGANSPVQAEQKTEEERVENAVVTCSS